MIEDWEGDVLREAFEATTGDRQAAYGPPDQDFRRTAGMWSAYLGVQIEPFQVAWMMMMLKASRELHQAKRDNYVDAAGYARCGYLCRKQESFPKG